MVLCKSSCSKTVPLDMGGDPTVTCEALVRHTAGWIRALHVQGILKENWSSSSQPGTVSELPRYSFRIQNSGLELGMVECVLHQCSNFLFLHYGNSSICFWVNLIFSSLLGGRLTLLTNLFPFLT